MRHKIVLMLTITCVSSYCAGIITLAALQSNRVIRSSGIIRAIGVNVYKDEDLTEILNLIDWGRIDPGENKSYSAWVENTGNDEQKLVMWTEAWQPANASDWISLSWDYGGQWIPVNASIPVVFTLSVDPLIEGITNFSFDIWVKGVH